MIEKLKLGTANVKLIKWPGNDVTVAMHILSQSEIQESVFAAERLFKGSKIEMNFGTADEYESEIANQKLYRALRDPAEDKPVADNIVEFKKSLTSGERKMLMEEYIAFEQECSPSPDNLSNDEFDKVLSDLKKKPLETIGTITSLAVAKKLLLTMASPPATLPQVNG